ncbi:MAG: hypothetical protein P8L68_07225 [Paracoccaceae bacterium]|nr:hypothetical protein [Paracoccaceae bacterium]MDG1736494.1 hypothetical protein [Paracoccaceae bacterium]MDG2258269.1 hypothetical protein [Paracoccaceae bacterium]
MKHIEIFKADAQVEPVHWKREGESCPDFETAILLRSLVLPAFDNATSWCDLAEALESVGFGLSIMDGHLTLIDADQGVGICTGRFLGKPLVELSAKFGKPIIRATLFGDACGEFVY